ncbi:hypothetical protein [Poseidonibacter antarcticus]|uniref:hypothetical protein n=1 Tax=Poseidonibacter antarcticus TaxID=2478538 RepID=UPI000EF4B0D9|nr:hypothetical protein [Poseidonibacter antarcticus]
MSQILLLDKLLDEYKLWTLKLISSSKDIKNNILQTGSGKNVEEKIASIIIASIFVYIFTGLLSFFGLYSGGFILGVVFFGIGLFLSKFLNKTIFGVERKEEDLKDDEKLLLSNLEKTNEIHKQIRTKINDGEMIVNFIEYGKLLNEFRSMLSELQNYNTNHLAYKYRLSHKLVVSKYNAQVKKFDAIYAHK